MRYYELKIDGATIAKLDSDNPCALRIKFNIHSFSDESNGIPSIISINNAPIELFTQAQNLNGKTIQLYAGIDMGAPILNALGISQLASANISTPIYNGFINAVLTNMVARETEISLVCGANSQNFEKALGDKIAIPFHIEKGDLIGTKMTDFLNENLPTTTWIDKTLGLAETAYQNKQKGEIKFTSYKEIQEWLNKYNIYIQQEGATGTLYYKNGDTDTRSIIEILEINSTDLIEQPQYTSYTECALTCMLNSRYKLGRRLKLATNVISSISSLASLNGNAYASSGALQGNVATFIGGTFLPIAIIHTGDSANIQAGAWSTTIQGVRE